MRILYVGRLFSGLESSIVSRTWKPTGVPTIHKVIERLDRCAELHLVLTDKDDAVLWRETSDQTIAISGLKASVTMLSGSAAIPLRRGTMTRMLRELRQTWRVLRAVRRLRPDLVYIDHGNAIAAAVLARLSSVPVVFRVMGVYPAMRTALTAKTVGYRALRWAYRAPFALVICTEDGSGGVAWLRQALRPGVRSELMLNGVDPIPETHDSQSSVPIPQNRTVVLFVGKLEPAKGCDVFLDGFLRASAAAPGELHALIVGTGTQAGAMKARADSSKAGDTVTFVARVPHAEMLKIQRRADIYVSLNRLGNFSNANLEAMRVGASMILPASLPEVGIDDPTSRLLPPDTHERIADPDAAQELSERLLQLHRDPARRKELSAKMKAVAARLLPTWQERVDREVDLLFAVAGKAKPVNGAA